MKKVRVLIADDSELSRSLIKSYLQQDPSIEVVGEATDGREAVELARLLTPQVITMDVHMPNMGGLEAIEAIMSQRAIPILVVSSLADAKTAYDALLRGALDVMQKPEYDSHDAAQLAAKVKLLAGVSVFTRRPSRSTPTVATLELPRSLATQSRELARQQQPFGFERVFAIACSTGGPQALAGLLAALPETFAAPILIAQHMAQGFSQGMVEWLNKLTSLKVQLAKTGDRLHAGCVYVAPSEYHLHVDDKACLLLTTPQASDIYHPSCDQLLSSVASAFGAASVGMVLTGMGKDGVRGMSDIYHQQGITLAQDEASSLIFGMNRMAIEAGVVRDVLPLEAMPSRMMSLLA